MKFTKIEIDLCKQVAERYRKWIGKGDWYVDGQNNVFIWTGFREIPIKDAVNLKPIPLWTISDCLEWLQEKVETVELWRTKTTKKWICRLRNGKWYKANVPLEACLKAVLAVLEEQK